MIGTVLLFGVIGWIAWSYIQDAIADKHMEDRIREKILMKQALVARAPESAAAHEQLGDALREADKYEDAIAEYEIALELEAKIGSGGTGFVGGSGVEQKIRLARLERDERRDPAAHGQTLRTRQQPCMQCGHLANPGERTCSVCGHPLPVDSLFDTWRDTGMRGVLMKEVLEAFAMLAVICLALYLVSWLRLEVKLIVIFAAIIVLSNRVLKRIGPD